MGDIHKLNYGERFAFVKKIPETSHIKRAETRVVSNESDLRKAVEYFAAKEGSEGAYLKRYDSGFYELDGATLDNVKFKNTLSGDFKVKSVHKVKDAEAWNYLMTLEDGTPVGRSYNTSIKAKPGDILKIEFVNLNRYTDPKTKKVWYNFWSPRVVMKRTKKTADTKTTAEKLVEESKGTTSEKKWPKRYTDAVEPTPRDIPLESGRWKGMLQFDMRKKSIHLDFRYQTDPKHLFTWTLFLPTGLPEIPESAPKAKEMATKEVLPLVIETLDDPMKKFNCKPEKEIPASPSVFSRGDLGGGPGKIQPRYMWTFDTFDVEFGAVKSYYVELFTKNGKYVNGKVVFRKLENKEEWKKTPAGLMTWMMFITRDPTPYVISRRAVNKKWVPEQNYSALPRAIKNKIPEKYHYWKKEKESERRRIRDELFEALKKKEVKVDSKETDFEYKLQKQTWRGPHVTRYGPSRTEYHLLLEDDKIRDFISDEEPPASGLMKKGSKDRWNASGSIEPGTKLNPTKNTPSRIEVITEGRFRYIDDTIKFITGELKGLWTLRKEEDSRIWDMKKARKA